MTNMKTIRFCTAYYNEFEWAACTFNALKNSDKYTFVPCFRNGSEIITQRNSFINDFTDELLDFDYWYMFDADQHAEPEVLYKLLEHDKDIVGAPVPFQGQPDVYCTGTLKTPYEVDTRYPITEKGFKKVPYHGDGCVLIKRKVFEKVLEVHKSFIFWDGLRSRDEKGFERRSTHDYGFGKLVKELGFDIWVDFDLEVKHRQRK